METTNQFEAMAAQFAAVPGNEVRTEEDCVVIRYFDTSGDSHTIFMAPSSKSVEIEFAKGRNGCTLDQSTYRSIPAKNLAQARAILRFNATCMMSSLLKFDEQQPRH